MRKSGFFAIVLTALFTLALVLPASAAPTPKATGSIGMSGPLQYISFNAFDYGASANDKGMVSYTNFDHGGTATDVWDVRSWDTMWVNSTYQHSVIVDEIVPTSPMGYDFTAHGQYVGGYDWTMTGTVYGNSITFMLDRTDTDYWFSATGTIAGDGSMSGTATHSADDSIPTWMAPAASGVEVFHYEAAVTCAKVTEGWAAFAWTNPSPVDVVAVVTDEGSPGYGNDTFGFAAGSLACDTPPAVGSYPIVSGNLVVH